MENSTSMNPTTDLYETYWWLAPKYFKQLASRPTYLIAIESGIMLLITVTAFVGNFLICFAVLRNPRLRTATNLLILVLAVTDLLSACLTQTLATIVLMTGKWIVDVNPLDVRSFPCLLQGVMSPALIGLSMHIMALTAVNRYICVVHQRLYNKIFSKKSTLFMVAAEGMIILSLVSISCPAGFARITLDPRRAMCFTTFKQLKTSQMVSHVFLVFTVAVPLIIICLSYFRVFKAIRSSYFQGQADNTFSKTSATNAAQPISGATRIKEVKITKTVFAVLLGFLTCWIPAMMCNYMSYNMVDPRFPRQGELVFTYFLCLSSSINPFIYGATNRALRKEFLSSLSCRKIRKRTVVVPEAT